mmetsp:Transcript_7395/g.11839  ORF Transcript_7395/g.11839 Transcript_7395/m.11839 type:complete len:208 (+) Transcript_7395:73-696(+)
MRKLKRKGTSESTCEAEASPKTQLVTKPGAMKNPNTQSRKRRKVFFKDVEVREMYITIGDSSIPSDGGPPLGISPKMKSTTKQSLDSYEFERVTGRRLKSSNMRSPVPKRIGKERFVTEGRVPAAIRRRMLLTSASAEKDSIQIAERSAQIIQRERHASNSSLDESDFLSQQESICKGHTLALEACGEIDKYLANKRQFIGVAELFN